MLVTLIGIGGVGSVIALRLGTNYNLHLVDMDFFESKNSHRQPLANLYPAQNKAAAHADFLNDMTSTQVMPPKITRSDKAVEKESTLPLSSLIIAAVDNNKARNAAREIALRTDTPLIIAANEQFDGEASLLMPEWAGTALDPWVTWPQLYDETPPEERPIHCTDPRIAIDAPQTTVANFMAAAGAIWLSESLIMRRFEMDYYDAIRVSFTQNFWRSQRPSDIITNDLWKTLQ